MLPITVPTMTANSTILTTIVDVLMVVVLVVCVPGTSSISTGTKPSSGHRDADVTFASRYARELRFEQPPYAGSHGSWIVVAVRW
uniref:Putative secreted protein n=1 Tax=Anopheles darlingi TaxID=43151 RepID=A0A2M4D1Q9_ANODA